MSDTETRGGFAAIPARVASDLPEPATMAADPCCGTRAEAAAEGSCCGSAAKADAVAAGQGCCG